MHSPRLRALTLALGLASLAGCSDDASPVDGSPRGDAVTVADRASVLDRVAADTTCPEGEKRCGTLYVIHECVGGVWKPIADCKTRTSGGQPCTCSPTLMFVCALGGKECP
jgi:hypothetical protein